MKIKITCPCGAAFEIKSGAQHPKEISCPNCGKQLPDNASCDLLKMFEAFHSLDSKLLFRDTEDFNSQYSFEISHNI